MGSFFKVFSFPYALWWTMICARESPYQRSPIKWTFILSNDSEPRAGWYLTTSLWSWQTSLYLFLCFGLWYINWHRLRSKYGCFAMKDLWQSCLIDILANVLEILVLIFAPWLDFAKSNKIFSPFLLFNVSFCLWCFCLWTTFACHVESLLFYLLARSYNWT
jgi:hypothetical protein